MKFLAVESLDGVIVAALRAGGREVTYVAELSRGVFHAVAWNVALAAALAALAFPALAAPTPTAPAGAATVPANFQLQVVKQADGSWRATTPAYTARIDSTGMLSSIRFGALELLGGPMQYQSAAKLAADTFNPTPNGLHVHLTGPGGAATIDYTFLADGWTVTPTWRHDGFANISFNFSHQLLGIELLNYKGLTEGGEATWFSNSGEIRGVPAVASSRNQMVRLHFPGLAVRAYYQAWGAPFNYESAGSIRDYTWSRAIINANQPLPIPFRFATVPAGPTLPALPFVPRTTHPSSLYYVDEPCDWQVDLGQPEALRPLQNRGLAALRLDWQLFDSHDQPAGAGRVTLPLNASGPQRVVVRPPAPGYYNLLFRLTDPTGAMQESSFLTRFSLIRRIPGMVNRIDPAPHDYSEYAVMAQVGLGAVRESHNIGDFFSNQPQTGPDWVQVPDAPGVFMNTRALDDLFNHALVAAVTYNENYLFQANSRPAYATPPVYEAMAYALVSRYHDRCHLWEVENEPNFSYKPADYVTKALVPFARGAHRADPTCTVMGPACVSLKQTLEFMQAIYDAHANTDLNAISTHTYPGPGESWEQFGNLATINELRTWMVAHGDGDKPIWQTEQGYAWDNTPKIQAARYAVRQFLEGWRLGIPPDHQYYFYPHWHGFEDWYLQGSGEAGSEESWLPAATALRVLAENTHGLQRVGDVPTPYKGIFMTRFEGPGGDVIAAWTFDFPVRLRVQAPGLQNIVGFMGEPLRLKPGPTGALDLPLSGEPIYIHVDHSTVFNVAGADWGSNLALLPGATATASSFAAKTPTDTSNLPARAIDGNWNLWEDVPGLPGRTTWKSAEKDPSPARPDWLEVQLPTPRLVNRVVALGYLPAVSPSPRNYRIQAEVNGQWRTVGSGEGVFTWVLLAEFPPVTTRRVRLQVTAINDGWHRDRRWMHVLMGPDATNYTESKLLVSELEVYGPGASPLHLPLGATDGAAAL